MPRKAIDRRAFLGTSAGAFICTIGGREIAVRSPQDATKADAAARAVARPAQAEPTGPFPAPQPAAGGARREYWIQARSLRWDPIPTRPRRLARRARPGQAHVPRLHLPAHDGRVRPPGGAGVDARARPTAEVGDLLVVHFRNADEELGQPVTMHPHGVRYNPDYDGSYVGAYTRPGGFVEPGEEFTYLWEATPDSVGVWPYHDHGPNHMLNTFRGLFGAIVIRERGAKAPDVEQVLGAARAGAAGHGAALVAAGDQRPRVRRQHADDPRPRGAGRRAARHGHGRRVARLPRPRPPLARPERRLRRHAERGPNEVITARFTEDNPGRWLYHCHVFSHQDGGMAGWYVVDA